MITGSCLCGAVRFSVRNGGESVAACHCTQCRKHIFTADKGDYYEIADGVPQREN